MEIRQVEFLFKGQRDYIQGPDLFNKMIDVGYPVESLSNIRFLTHHFVRTPLCQIYQTAVKEELNGISDFNARCQFDVNRSTYWLALKEISTNNVAKRGEFDEEQIISLCRAYNQSIILTGLSPFSFIETIVSMNKHLHLSLFPEVEGKWIFTRVDLDGGCDEREKLQLDFKHNMNYRLTRSDIVVNRKKIGDIYFSLVKP